MRKRVSRALVLLLITGLLLSAGSAPPASGWQAGALVIPADIEPEAPALGPQPQAALPVFRFPVVPGSITGGYFDHLPQSGQVMFYDGRFNPPGAGFYFRCTNPSMYDWVGCQDAVSGEPACNNTRELWYDNHRGIDYEFSPNWHTGAVCDPGRFGGLTMPIYSPARGQVLFAGVDPNRPGNGWHIRLKHDLNGNGNFNDDNFRSIYLHFTANSLAVYAGQIVEEGQFLGFGGSTGYSSSPHLHFEVQRSSDFFQTTLWSVDPYGWQGAGGDPWPYANARLFRDSVNYTYTYFLPSVMFDEGICAECGELLQNGGFEAGRAAWFEEGSQLIASISDPNLKVPPHQGAWLGWLGGIVNTSDSLYQVFQVPPGAREAVLRYYLNVVSSDGGANNDRMSVNLRDGGGQLLRQLDSATNTYAPGNTWVGRTVTISDLGNWQGQTLMLSFDSVNNETLQTSFFVDTVSLNLINR